MESQNVSPFLVWFISLNIITIRFVHIVALSELPTLKGRIRFHCVSIPISAPNFLKVAMTDLFLDLCQELPDCIEKPGKSGRPPLTEASRHVRVCWGLLVSSAKVNR